MNNLTVQAVHKNKNSGFTLIEIAIVVIIFGIIMIPLLDMYSRYLKEQKRIDTIARVDDAISQIRIFRINNNAAPCPADRTLTVNDPNYGLEDCVAAAAILATGGCNPSGGICRVPGARTPWASSVPPVLGRDTVVIGAYPFRTVASVNGISRGLQDGLDGWDNKLNYAVTDSATNMFPGRTSEDIGTDFKYGVIKAIDEFGRDTAGINNDALFVVFSSGETARGAYQQNGTQAFPCDLTTKDGENCNGDAVFTRAIANYDGAGAGFYDDYAYFFKDQTGDLWGYMINPVSSASLLDIRKLNSANVGVNTATTIPTAQLTVNGAVRAPTTIVSNLCSSSTTNCMPLGYLYDTYSSNTNLTTPDGTKAWRNMCGPNEFAKGIDDGKIECVSSLTIPPPPGGAGANCPAGEYITAILSNGCIVCTNGNTYPSAALCN